jgi:hypothetical protein
MMEMIKMNMYFNSNRGRIQDLFMPYDRHYEKNGNTERQGGNEKSALQSAGSGDRLHPKAAS